MASVAARARIWPLSPGFRQFLLVWLAGSLTTGTLAAVYLSVPPPAQPLLAGTSGIATVPPFGDLPLPAAVAVIVLVTALFAGLGVLAWRTPAASWLPGSGRGRALWVLLTGTLGLAAWFFAATVTFAAGFSQTAQVLLGYAGGGLPFALVAAVLQRSWRVSAAAAVMSGLLVTAGLLLVASRPAGSNAVVLYFRYLDYLFGGPGTAGPIRGPIPGPGSPFGTGELG